MLISFIMPAKNAADFIISALKPFLESNQKNWELIIVNDNSDDNTEELINRNKSEQIKIFNNIGNGKIDALNYGFSKSSGEHVKFIDADDVIDLTILDFITDFKSIYCHDAVLIDENNKELDVYRVNKDVLRNNYNYVVQNIAGIPRWSWSFPRQIAESFFPMPVELPFEDGWFAINLKRYDDKIVYIRKKLYKYRQHGNQTFGGMYNYSTEVIKFRANRMVKLIKVLESNLKNLNIDDETIFDDLKIFYQAQINGISFLRIFTLKITFKLKIKLLLFTKLNNFAPAVFKLKWKIETIR